MIFVVTDGSGKSYFIEAGSEDHAWGQVNNPQSVRLAQGPEIKEYYRQIDEDSV